MGKYFFSLSGEHLVPWHDYQSISKTFSCVITRWRRQGAQEQREELLTREFYTRIHKSLFQKMQKRIVPGKECVQGMDWKFFSIESILKERRWEKLEPNKSLYQQGQCLQCGRPSSCPNQKLCLNLKSWARLDSCPYSHSVQASGQHSFQWDKLFHLNSSQLKGYNFKECHEKMEVFILAILFSMWFYSVSPFLFISCFTS